MSFEVWKADLANALERQFNWGTGEGLLYLPEEPGEVWHDAYDEGLSPEGMAFEEHASFLADEGNEGAHR